MTVILENEYTADDFSGIFSFDYEETARLVTERVLETENCPYEAEVAITLIDDDTMRKINLETRGIDRTTDVLSFPAVQYDIAADFSHVEEDVIDNFNPETGNLMLGDILISVPKVKAQAEEYGHSAKREFAFLIAHSMLHLIGYDHIEEEEASVMYAKQDSVLNSLGITREDA